MKTRPSLRSAHRSTSPTTAGIAPILDAAMVLLLSACGPAPLPESSDPDWTVDEPNEPNEPIGAAAPTCLPQAAPDALQSPPEFAGSLPDCQMPALPADNFPSVTCDEHSLTLVQFGSTTTWHFADPQGSRIAHIEFQNAIIDDDVTEERTWTFDDQERLIYESQVFQSFVGPPQTTELTHTYEDDLLISIELLNADNLTRTLFTYDEEDRLSRAARIFPDGTQETADWTYDANRPVELTRQRDDLPLVHMRWSYSAEGHLEQMHVDADVASQAPAALDSYAHHSDWPRHMGLPSHEAPWTSPETTDDACSPLPTSLTHGYPAHEEVYTLLGLDNPLDLFQVSTAYQGYGLFVRFGLDYWVGHDGAGFAWPAAVEPGDHWQTTRDFNATGLMVTEELQRFRGEHEVLESATRQREIQNGRILSDTLERQTATDSLPTRTLTFDYDAQDRLTSRTLSSSDQTILQRTSWIWNDDRLIEHHVDSQRDQPSPTGATYRLDDTTEAIPTGRFTLDLTEHHYWLGAHTPPREFTQPAP